MKFYRRIPGLMLFIVLSSVLSVLAQSPVTGRYYLIGNSLTWDTSPELLSGTVHWHVDCGVNLPHIYAKPDKPCVSTSTLWPKALRDGAYDVVSVQPHYGSTLAQDVETISEWMQQQPKAVFVIHSGWAFHHRRGDEFASYASPTQMTHSPGYIRALIAELRRLHPGREIRQTMAQNLLAMIDDDIALQRAPLKRLTELYRDDIHVTRDQGRYLMHNAMRRALGQPLSVTGFEKVEPAMITYLDGVLSWLQTSPADQGILQQVLSMQPRVDRSTLVAKLTDKRLRSKIESLLPEIERAVTVRRDTLALEAEIKELGGTMICTPSGPPWLYLATHDNGTELFDVPTSIDLYNGNNPLKGKGGRNERVHDDWLKRLAGLTTLRRLDLANCAVQGDGLQHVGTLTGLRELNLTLTPVNDAGLRHLGQLTELRMLGLASTQCTGSGFEYLRGLDKLSSVNFHFTPLNDAGLQAIAKLPITDRLWFAHTHFTDAGATYLAKLTQLKRCGIGSKEKTSTGEAVAALTLLPLEELALLDNQADAIGIRHASQIVTLRKLDVSHAPTVKDDSLPLIARLPNLEEFKLGSAQVTDVGLQSLVGAKSLKKLTLSGLKKITPQGVDQLRKQCPELVIEVQ